MEALNKVLWYNNPKIVNDNFEIVKDAIEGLEASEITQADAIAGLSAGTAITTVPASFAALSDVQSYLAGANVMPNIQTRLSAIETKVNAIITALRASGVIEE